MKEVALAVDIGGTKLECALVDSSGRVRLGSLHRRATGNAVTLPVFAEALRAAVGATLKCLRPDDRLMGVGVGAAGPIDRNGDLISPHNMPGLVLTPLLELIRPLVPDLPLRLRLDGTCIVVAEHWLGAARGAHNALAIVVSTGVGGGLILEDRLVTGKSGNAGHVGQIQIRRRQPGSPIDSGTLESIASGPRTVAWAQAQGWVGQTGEHLADAYASGNVVARKAVRRSARAVGSAIVSVATLLDLEIAVLGGGFVNVAADYIDIVRGHVERSAIHEYARRIVIEPSGLSGTGPIVGAAALVFSELG